VQCLLVSSKISPSLEGRASYVTRARHSRRGVSTLPAGSDEFVSALMVSMEDYPRASALADSVVPMLNVMAY
jgi:hypothetical protein